jgi:hypothetical protein
MRALLDDVTPASLGVTQRAYDSRMDDEELDRLVHWIQETDREELRGSLSVPSLGPDQAAFGPNIPILGAWEAVTLPSGMVVPRTPSPSPAKLFGAFATGEDVLGRPTSWDELVEAISLCDFKDLIGKLLSLNAFLEHRGVMDRGLSRELALGAVPEQVIPILLPLVESGERVFTSPQVVLMLAKLVLSHAGESEATPVRLLGPLILGAADHIGGKIGSEHEDWPLELTRHGWFAFRDRHSLLWGRFQRLWREVIPSLSSDPRFVDPGSAIEQEFGIDYDNFLALGIGFSSTFDQRVRKQQPPLWFKAEIQGTVVPSDQIARYVESIAAERSWFEEEEGTLEDPSYVWTYTRMRRRPLLLHNDLLIPFSLGMLREKVTDGLFYTVADALAVQGPAHSQRWRDFFGLVWETYVRRLIEEGVGDLARLVPEHRLISAWPEESICDNVIEYPDRYLLVEAVARRFTEATVARGSLFDLQDDLRKAALIKSRQLCNTIRLLRDRSEELATELGRSLPASGSTQYTPVVVLPGPFPLMPILYDRVSALLKEDDRCEELTLPTVDDVAFLTASDFELLVGTAAHTGQSLVELLDAWRTSGLREMNWRMWASETIPGGSYLPAWLVEGGKAGLRWGAQQLFHKDDLAAYGGAESHLS